MLDVQWSSLSDSEGICALSVSSDGSAVLGLARGALLVFPASAEAAAATPLERHGHNGGTLALQHSKTGRMLISGGGDGYIRLWTTGAYVGECTASPVAVRIDAPGAIRSRNSTLVESVSTNEELWAAAAGKAVACGEVSTDAGCSESGAAPGYLQPLTHHVDSVLLLADGRLAAASFGGVFLWSREQCRCAARQPEPRVPIGPCTQVLAFDGWARSLAAAPAGAWLAATTEKATMRLWRVRDCADFVISGYGGPVEALAWRDDSTQLACSSGQVCTVWPFARGGGGPAGGAPSKYTAAARISCLAFASGGGPLAIGDVQGNVYLVRRGSGDHGAPPAAAADGIRAQRIEALSPPMPLARELCKLATSTDGTGAHGTAPSGMVIDGVVDLAWLSGGDDPAVACSAASPRLLVCLASGCVGLCATRPAGRVSGESVDPVEGTAGTSRFMASSVSKRKRCEDVSK